MYGGRVLALHVERCGKDHIPLDHLLGLLHLCVESGITDELRGILDFPTCLVKPGDGSHDCAFHHISQVRDSVKGHPFGPLVNDFHQAEPGLAGEVICVLARQNDLVQDLIIVHLVRNPDDRLLPFFQAGSQCRLVLGLLLEDKGRKKRDDLLGLILC